MRRAAHRRAARRITPRHRRLSVLDDAKGITAVGAVVNVGLGCCKVGAGSTLGSPALIADGAHSLSDVLTDVVAYWSYAAARLPPDADHPFGHGKFEAGGSAVVGGCLVAAGAGAAHHAAGSAFEPAEALELYAVATCGSVATVSIVAKEWLFRRTRAVGEALRSDVLVANAFHHRSDAWSSVAALAGIAGGHGLGVTIADPVAGVLVGGAVVPGAIARDAARANCSTRRWTANGSRGSSAPSRPRCRAATSLRARKAGPGVLVDLRLGVEKGLSASAAHQIGEHAKVALGREARAMGLGLADVAVHLDPGDRQESGATDDLGALPDELERRIRAVALGCDRVRAVSHVVLSYEGDAIAAKVDVVLPDALTIGEAHAVAYGVRRALLRRVPEITGVDIDCELDEARPPPPTRRRRRYARRPW
ncbi:cation transmembrane transporter [Aureococcus anophagefferens]|nr:cation transmembrane transporter [Aureococcus anophagefferens]